MNIICKSLLFVHGAWVMIHSGMTELDLVNPWKLGGYAMYTVPAPCHSPHIYYVDEYGVENTIPVHESVYREFYRAVTPGCIGQTDTFYARLIERHPVGPGQSLHVRFYKLGFVGKSADVDYHRFGHAKILMDSSEEFIIVDEQYCGRRKEIVIAI